MITGKVGEKLCRAGFGNGAKMRDHLISRHTNAVVRDGQRTRVFVERDVDMKITVIANQSRLFNGSKTQLVDGV